LISALVPMAAADTQACRTPAFKGA